MNEITLSTTPEITSTVPDDGTATSPESSLPGWFSINEAARLAGLSPNTLRRYIASGRLPARRVLDRIFIEATELPRLQGLGEAAHQRTRQPLRWQRPTRFRGRVLTTLTAQLREGQQDALEHHLWLIERHRLHRFPGTVSRTIAMCETPPPCMLIALVWDQSAMPPLAERESALAALRADLEDAIDWTTESFREQPIVLQAH